MKGKCANPTTERARCGFCGHLVFISTTASVANLDNGQELPMCEACQKKFKVWEE